MNKTSFSFFSWKDALLGFVYGIITLTVCFAFMDSLLVSAVFALVSGSITFVIFMTATSLIRRRRNKRWLKKFNDEHRSILDQEMINVVTNRVCEIHRGYSHFLIFRFATLVLYNYFHGLSLGDDPRAMWVVSAYREKYER